jgi:serine protease AprX
MARLSERLVEDILMEGRAGRRFLSESAVELKLWMAYADDPFSVREILMTPYNGTEATELARLLFAEWRHERDALRVLVANLRSRPSGEILPGLSPLEGVVAARYDFFDFLSFVLPKTGYELRSALDDLFLLISASRGISRPPTFGDLFRLAYPDPRFDVGRHGLSPAQREALLIMFIVAAPSVGEEDLVLVPLRPGEPIPFDEAPVPLDVLFAIATAPGRRLIYRVNRNRELESAIVSVETIKADAAHRVFDISCKSLTWAVIDSGIDGSHPAFLDHARGEGKTRVDKAYDFTRLRLLASYDLLLDPQKNAAVVAEIATELLVEEDEAASWLNRLRQDAENGRPFDWDALSRLLETRPDRPPLDAIGRPIGHGTHVAGVLAGDWRTGENKQTTVHVGVCPDLRLYDLRVLANTPEDTEFAVIAALEFVRWLNNRNRYVTIHGANLSLALRHDLDQHACGRTPVCLACESTVDSGVVVVAAAGNWGAEAHVTLNNETFAGYATVSIADPGNAESVITVGATHRDRPHEYGVSFFSSRGPTGDGRAKPDVVAPGERIDGPLPDLGYGRLDGTSMAAPHVSGVAALLMARNPEMIGRPRRIKQVIVSTATDLGRVREFQGAGLVDALRALQAV